MASPTGPSASRIGLVVLLAALVPWVWDLTMLREVPWPILVLGSLISAGIWRAYALRLGQLPAEQRLAGALKFGALSPLLGLCILALPLLFVAYLVLLAAITHPVDAVLFFLQYFVTFGLGMGLCTWAVLRGPTQESDPTTATESPGGAKGAGPGRP